MSWCLRVAVAVSAVALFAPAPCRADDVAGTYKVAGKWKGGEEYTATVVLSQRGESYEFHWKSGKEEYAGVALLDGDVLAVQYSGGGEAGVYLFKRSGKNWEGKWIRVKGKGLVHQEKWTKTK